MSQSFEIELDIPAKDAWVAAGEKFGDTGQWTSFLDSSYLEGELVVGGSRVCKQGKKILTEKITEFCASTMSLEYELITGKPIIVSSASNKWVIEPLGLKRSKLIMSPTTKLKWWAIFLAPILSLGLKTILPKVLEEFKYWVEKGEVHPRKKKMLIRTVT